MGRMINQLGDVYWGTYDGVGAHPRLLPHAITEMIPFHQSPSLYQDNVQDPVPVYTFGVELFFFLIVNLII